MSTLIIKQNSREFQIELTRDVTTIGRADDNVISLKDIKISRHHCQIIKTKEGYKLVDTESSNGTFVNGQRIESHLLQKNDLIKIGDTEIIFLGTQEEVIPILTQEDLLESTTASSIDSSSAKEEISLAEPRFFLPDQERLEKISCDSDTVLIKPEPSFVEEVSSKEATVSPILTTEEEEKDETIAKEEQLLPKKTTLVSQPSFKKKTSTQLKKISNLKEKTKKITTLHRRIKGLGDEKLTARTYREPRGINKTIIIIAAAIVLVGIVGLIIAISSSGREEVNLKNQEKILNEAKELVQKGEYQKALAIYNDFLNKYKDSKFTQTVKDNIAQLETKLNRGKIAAKEWERLKQKIDATPVEQYGALLKELDAFIAKYSDLPIAKIAQEERPRIERIAASGGVDEIAFAETRERIEREYVAVGNYRGALNEWELFLKKYPNLNEILRNEVETEKERIKRKIEELK